LAVETSNGYSLIETINQVLKVFDSPVYLSARDRYDCSDLNLGEMVEGLRMVPPTTWRGRMAY
jgi:hypothetical protein